MAPGKRRTEKQERGVGRGARADAAAQGWSVYMVRCRDGSLYTGATNDLPRRVERHNASRGAAYTRARRPVALAWSEPAASRSEALRREAAIKRMSRAEKLLLAGAAPAPQKRSGRANPAAPSSDRVVPRARRRR